MIMTTNFINNPLFTCSGYWIEVDVSDKNHHYQRHIYKNLDGTLDVDEWIKSIIIPIKDMLKKGYKRKRGE